MELGGVGMGCKEGEGEEGMVCQKEWTDRKVSDVWEEILVGWDVVHHTSSPTTREACGNP